MQVDKTPPPRAAETKAAGEAPLRAAPLVMRDPAGLDVMADELVLLSRASEGELEELLGERGYALLADARLASLDLRLVRVRLPAGRSVKAELAALDGDARLAWAQPNHVYWLLGTSRDAGLAMHGLKADRPAVSGTIALVDGPVDTGNPALAGARIEETDFAIGGGASPHGTAIAEILVGTGTFGGVARGARLLSLPAFAPVGTDRWQSTSADIARALDAAVLARPEVANLSFGTPGTDRTAQALLRRLEAGGTCVAAAAGNGSGGAVLFPGRMDETLAVTAVDGARRIYANASRGAEIDIAAWGVELSAAVPGGRRSVSGTSFATAVVSGSMLHMPACNGDRAPGAMRAAVADDALDLGDSGRDALFGAGLFLLGEAGRGNVEVRPVEAKSSEAASRSGDRESGGLPWWLILPVIALLALAFFAHWRRRHP